LVSILLTELKTSAGKYCLWRILTPYLVNVLKLSDEESFSILRQWLDNCNSIMRLSFDPKYILKYNIRNARKIGYYPISWNTLKSENINLYQHLEVGMYGDSKK
jgi:hypothetical protein